MQFGEPRGPQPLPRGGPLFAQLIHAVAPQAATREYIALGFVSAKSQINLLLRSA